jgi:hypothetical protein
MMECQQLMIDPTFCDGTMQCACEAWEVSVPKVRFSLLPRPSLVHPLRFPHCHISRVHFPSSPTLEPQDQQKKSPHLTPHSA